MDPIRRTRLTLFVTGVLCLAAALGVRLYVLQVVRADGFKERAERQHNRRIIVQPARGAILDRTGRELAVSLRAESFYCHPERVKQPEQVARRLAPVLGVSRQDLLADLTSGKSFVYLSRLTDGERADAIRALELDPNAFGFLDEWKRHYPRQRLAGHVVGFANIDGKGIEGLEKELDRVLRVEPTVYAVLVDAKQGPLRRLTRGSTRRPDDVVLSLDLAIQHIVERELDRAMRTTGAKAASAMLIDPRTGDVLALANRPAADINQFGRSRPAARVNRAIVHYYEPGSTFKIVSMAAALERGGIRPHQLVFCENGTWNVDGRSIRDAKPHATLSARQVIERSSNIGMAKLTAGLPPDELYATIVRFGFGRPTGIELPGEVGGLLHSVERWSDYSQASLSFGQEIGVTVVQMAGAFATLANDGQALAPRLVLGRRGADGELRLSRRPAPRRVIEPKTARELTRMLELVVERGTGVKAAIDSYSLAGKSGTAQTAIAGGYSPTDYIASFGGFGPTDRPRLAGIVVLDTPHGPVHQGGQVAAPVFGRIMADTLRHLRAPGAGAHVVLAEARDAAAATPVVHRPAAASPEPLADRVPNLTGLSLREAVARLGATGCRVEAAGHGVVVAQSPHAGTALTGTTTCRLRLEPPAPRSN